MKQIILNLFNRFPKCYDIEIHLKDKDSWTNTDSKEFKVDILKFKSIEKLNFNYTSKR